MADIYNNFSYPVILDDRRDPEVSWTHHLQRGSTGGVDLAYPYGVPVLANAAGTITNVAWYGSGGHTVRLRMDDGRYIEYMHLSAFSLSSGASVRAGTQIGVSGSSGNGNLHYYAPHLHVHMYIGSIRVNLFHYFTAPSGLFRQVAGFPTGWQDLNTGLNVYSEQISSLNMGGQWPQTLLSQGGFLHHIAPDAASGWRVTSTNLPLAATSLSAVKQNAISPTVMAIEAGYLYQIVRDTAGWQKLWTGLHLIGRISAVYISGSWPAVMLSQAGVLYHIYGDSGGWHVESTGLGVGSEISAVHMGGPYPQVMSAEGGRLHQIWRDATGWRKASTGIAASGRISAVNMGGTWPQVILSENNALYQIVGFPTGWRKMAMGISGTSRISAVNMGGNWPQIHKVG